MATNKYFNNYRSSNEQNLMDDLVIEAVKNYGFDVFYVSRDVRNVDNILNEGTYSVFDKAFMTEIYLKSFDSFQGQGDFLSKFIGHQINDQMTLTLPIRTFNKNITNYEQTLTRPREGDLVFFPMNQKFFKITFVEHESVFYQSGSLYVYDIKCELLTFSNEVFQTGEPTIDAYTQDFKTDEIDDLETLNDFDPMAKNNFFEFEKDKLVDDTEFDPFKDILITSIKDRP